MKSASFVLFACLGLAIANSAVTHAGDAVAFVNPINWTVGSANSTYQEWDAFHAMEGNTPDVGYQFSPASGMALPTFSALAPALVTGSKNYYSFSDHYTTEAVIHNFGGAGMGTQVLVQTAGTLNEDTGVLLDSLELVALDGSALAGGANGDALATSVLFDGLVNSPFGEVTHQERLWEFFLPAYTGDFEIRWSNSVHSSLQALRVDTRLAPVPEPAAILVLAIGLAAVASGSALKRFARTRGGA